MTRPAPLLLGMIIAALMVAAFFLGTIYGRQDPPPEPTSTTIPVVDTTPTRDRVEVSHPLTVRT